MTTNTATVRAREWLGRNQLGRIEPSALLVARLEARRHISRILGGAALAVTAILGFWGAFGARSTPAFAVAGVDVTGLAWFVLVGAVSLLAQGAGLLSVYRVERRLIRARRTRTAHPTATSVARVLGTGHLAAILVMHGGGLLLGAATALLASRPPDRTLALVFLASVAVTTALSGLALATVLRRPSVAEDSESLLVDDVLRVQDARETVQPFPIVLAGVAGAGSTVGSWQVWTFLAFAGLGAVFWLYVAFSARHTVPVPAGVQG